MSRIDDVMNKLRGAHLLGSLLLCLAVLAGCATRLPVVTTPAYPDFPFPTVPQELAGTRAAMEHESAWVFLQADDLDEAARRFAGALGSDPGFHPSGTGLAFVELARGRVDAALAQFEGALGQAPDYAPALLGRGEALLATERVDEALESFEAALAADPGLTALRRRVAELRSTGLMDQVARARAAAEAGRDTEARSAYERVIAASPESGFLYVELAEVELRLGDTVSALEHLERAVALDPTVAAAWVLMSEILAARGDLDRAEQALLRADAIEPGEDIARRRADLEARRRAAGRPPEYLVIETADAITRGELAALIGVRFEAQLTETRGVRTAIVTDAREHWGYEWMVAVARAGIMDVDTNYRFQPAQLVTRADLAQVAVRLLGLPSLGAAVPAAGTRQSFSDLAPGHLSYAAASAAVLSGVLEPLDRNTFQPGRTVSGADAMTALQRVGELAGDGRGF